MLSWIYKRQLNKLATEVNKYMLINGQLRDEKRYYKLGVNRLYQSLKELQEELSHVKNSYQKAAWAENTIERLLLKIPHLYSLEDKELEYVYTDRVIPPL